MCMCVVEREIICIFQSLNCRKLGKLNHVFSYLQAVGITYGNLQTFSDKSAMVTKSLEYLGEILKYIKPYLGKKVSSAGLHLTYTMMGMFSRRYYYFPRLNLWYHDGQQYTDTMGKSLLSTQS